MWKDVELHSGNGWEDKASSGYTPTQEWIACQWVQ